MKLKLCLMSLFLSLFLITFTSCVKHYVEKAVHPPSDALVLEKLNARLERVERLQERIEVLEHLIMEVDDHEH